MKIGILTFQHSINYGAQLQCLALQTVIKSMGHDVEVIQYYPRKQQPFYRNINIPKNGIFRGILYMMLRLCYMKKLLCKFQHFKHQYMNLSSPCFDKNELAVITKHYDAIIIGSDQVWGPGFHSSKEFFLGWEPDYQGKRISYAPCCAVNSIKEQYKQDIASLLNQFTSISVRNKTTQDFVYNLTHIIAPIVLDPTFLYDFSCLKKTEMFSKPYILTYILGDEIIGGHKRMIEEIKKVYCNMPVVSIHLVESCPHMYSWSDRSIYTADPEEWLSYIKNAAFFYTDSFHGVVFALKYKIRFLAYYTESLRASRFIDLAELFKISPFIVTSVDDAIRCDSLHQSVNYDAYDSIIEGEIKKSMNYLYKSLS